MRCAIYARYSSDLQRDRSIDDQVRNCRRFAEKKGWVVLDGHIYTDRAISGASVIGRTGLLDLLRTAQESPKPFDYLLVDDTSRLSREMGEVESIIGQLHFVGIGVYFVAQGIDSKDDQSDIAVGFNSIMDSRYRRDLGKKTLRGMIGQVERNYNPCGRLYGYKYIRDEDPTGIIDPKTKHVRVLGTRIEKHPVESQVVKEIFEAYCDGLSMRDIAQKLDKAGHLPPGVHAQVAHGVNKPSWLPRSIHCILNNRRYCGDWTFNKTTWLKNPKTGKRKNVPRDKADWVEIKRPDLAIIDEPTWQHAQERIQRNKRGPGNLKGIRWRFLFTGLMKCHECGGSYVVVRNGHTPNPVFGCSRNWNKGSAGCSNNFRVRKDEIESTILSDIQSQLLSPPVLSAIVSKVNQKIKAKLSGLRKDSSGIIAQKKELSKKLSNIVAAIESGMSSEALRRRLAEIEAQIQELDRRIDVFSCSYDFSKLKIDEQYVEGWLDRIRELLNKDVAAARAKIMSLVGTFTLSPETVDGIKYIRVNAQADIVGLVRVAVGRGDFQRKGNQAPGGDE